MQISRQDGLNLEFKLKMKTVDLKFLKTYRSKIVVPMTFIVIHK